MARYKSSLCFLVMSSIILVTQGTHYPSNSRSDGIDEKGSETMPKEESPYRDEEEGRLDLLGETQYASHLQKRSTDVCLEQWDLVLETSSSGNVINGSVEALYDAFTQGSRVKFFSNDFDGGAMGEFEGCRAYQGNICCQFLRNLQIDSWNVTVPDPVWMFAIICTTGDAQKLMFYVGDNFIKQKTVTIDVSWYATSTTCDGRAGLVYAIDQNGNVTSGTNLALTNAVERGYTLTVVNGVPNSFQVHNIEVEPDTGGDRLVGVQSIWHHGFKKLSDILIFSQNKRWVFFTIGSNGQETTERWSVGSHTRQTAARNMRNFDWFVDPCWRYVYANDENGNEVGGSLDALIEAVEDGHRVKALFGNYSAELDNFRILGGHVSGQIVSFLEKNGTLELNTNVTWAFRILNTDGTVNTFRVLVGEAADGPGGDTTERMPIAWYVDTRSWVKLLNTDTSGAVISGSKASIRDAITRGADIRVAVTIPGDLVAGQQFLRADSLRLGPDGHTAMQSTRVLGEEQISASEVLLFSQPSWAFKTVSTLSEVGTIETLVGDRSLLGSRTEAAEVIWFGTF
ncbi:uncharacterized protein [Haliotis asinina]|uniref:uncharacterized protein n=1 Tax=Haliotis asinina TaxID=109174 RepID=UPI0035322C41